MWVDLVLFAAKHHSDGDPAGVVLGLIVIVVIFAVLAVRASTARYDIVSRNGLPYCPQCNRQVSLRRDFCRACGHRFVSYGPPPPSEAEIERQRSLDAWRENVAAEVERYREKRRQATEQEKERGTAAKLLEAHERDERNRARGIRPGPWAWFWALPDLAQAILLGIVIAIPAVLILVMVFGQSAADLPVTTAASAPTADGPALPADATVYVVKGGTKYHRQACIQLAGAGTPKVFHAVVREFTPCRECWLFPEAPASPGPASRGSGPLRPLVAAPKPAERKDATAAIGRAPASAPADRAPIDPAVAVAITSATAIRSPKVDYRQSARVDYRAKEPDPEPRPRETPYGATATGIPTYTGPRGGVYHYSKSGRKVYESSSRRRR